MWLGEGDILRTSDGSMILELLSSRASTVKEALIICFGKKVALILLRDRKRRKRNSMGEGQVVARRAACT